MFAGHPLIARAGSGIFFGHGHPHNLALPTPGRQTSQRAEVYALYITVPDNELRRRLLSRGREDAAAIDGRLARSRAILPTGSHVLTIPNEGTVAEGVELVRRALLGDEPVMAAARQRTIDASRPAPAAGWESTRVRVIAVAASVLCAALIIGRLSRATSRASS